MDPIGLYAVKTSSSSRNLLNPSEFRATPMRDRSPSRSSADSAILDLDKVLPPRQAMNLEVLPGTASMVEASKKAFLQVRTCSFLPIHACLFKGP